MEQEERMVVGTGAGGHMAFASEVLSLPGRQQGAGDERGFVFSPCVFRCCFQHRSLSAVRQGEDTGSDGPVVCVP